MSLNKKDKQTVIVKKRKFKQKQRAQEKNFGEQTDGVLQYRRRKGV